MARLRHGVIWSRIGGQPEKMGNLVLTEEEASFTYTREWLASGQPGFCLLGDGGIWGDTSVVYPVSERIPVFPRLLSLIPGNNPRNLQRRHYLDLLRRQSGREPPPGIETEWQLLLLGGHGGIGHIDVFADDLTAARWYRHNPSSRGADAVADASRRNAQSELWRMIKREVMDENLDFDPQIIEEALGPTPSVGGMIPKLLVSLDPEATTRPRFFPPDTPGLRNVVLKVEPPEYRGLLDLEALCLRIHRDAGFATPDWQRIDHGGLRLLAVTRFDSADRPLPMESLFSVIATGDHHFRETADILLEELGAVIDRLRQVAALPADAGEHLYRRFLLALLTGNGDLHLENLSLLGGLDDCRWAPVYDPAPMRAWPRHDLVSAIPFDASNHADHGAFFIDLGRHFGLSTRRIQRCIDDALGVTQHYADAIMGLAGVPKRQRRQLRDIVLRERELLRCHSHDKAQVQ